MQTDPIGYGDGMNLYGYVGNDPVNFTDPSGYCKTGEVAVATATGAASNEDPDEIVSRANYRFLCVRMPSKDGGGYSPAADGGRNGNAPQQSDPPCAYKDPKSGQCVYVRDDKGKLQPTPDQHKKICANFNALQDGATKTNDTLTAVGVTAGTRGGLLGTIVGGLTTFGAFVSSITTGAGYRPFGLTIIPKSAPPSGC